MRKLWIGLGIGCAALLALAVVAGGLALYFLTRSPQDIVARVEAPLQVAAGERFTVDVHVENTARRVQTVYSVDVADAYLEGIAIERSEPPFREAFHVPLDDTMSYQFMAEVPAGGRIVLRFHAVALAPGDHDASLDVCVNSQVNFLTLPLRTRVEPVPAP